MRDLRTKEIISKKEFTLEEKQSALAELISTKQNYETLKRWNENVVDIIHSDIITDEMHYILDCSFEELWFDFPTPFEKGDIVWLPPKCNERGQMGKSPDSVLDY